MIRLLHLNYYYHKEFSSPEEVIEKHKLASGFVNFIKHRVKFISVKHLNYNGEKVIGGVPYYFFKSRNRFWYIPFATHKIIKQEQPDVILAEGLIFPIQLIFLKKIIGKHCRIIVQHHGEKPFNGVKQIFQKITDHYVDAYIFTSQGNAKEWVDKKIIKSISKCSEVLEASTYFTQANKKSSKIKLGIKSETNFLWVGRLNANKDPLTVLAAFEKYLVINPAAKLYVIYQTEELLPEIKVKASESNLLKNSIILVGKKEHDELPDWYSAADYFISGSHSEGSGYALIEAMACGCIPVVTNIPSFNKITNGGRYGILYEPGNAADLYKKLSELKDLSTEAFSTEVKNHFTTELSYETISNKIYDLCQQLIGK